MKTISDCMGFTAKRQQPLQSESAMDILKNLCQGEKYQKQKLSSVKKIFLLIRAIVSPTDPILATTIVTGALVEKKIPHRVCHIMSAESGANDGLFYKGRTMFFNIESKP